MSGWSELGYVLGGGGKNDPAAYQSGLRSAADGEYALARAAKEQAERMMVARQMEQQQRILSDPAVQGELGMTPAQAALWGASERGNFNANTLGLGNIQEQAMRARAEQALTGELGAGNAALAAISGKPIERMKVQGDMAFDPYAAGGDMQVTELGRAKIAKQGRDNVNWSTQATDQGLVQVNPRTGDVRPVVLGDTPLTRPPTGSADPNAAIDKMLAEQTFYTLANPDMDPAEQNAAVARLKAAADQLRGKSKEGLPEPKQAGPAAPKSKAEFDALPSGTRFTAPDGTIRIKP